MIFRIVIATLLWGFSSACTDYLAPELTGVRPLCSAHNPCEAPWVCHDGHCLELVSRCDADGLVEQGEECDDGNDVDEDACTNACRNASCGDGFRRLDLEEGAIGYEACDDGNESNDDGCTNGCELPRCGDGYVGDGEECDDGNLVDADACTNGCRRARCGDGVERVDLLEGAPNFESCDDGNGVETDGCTSQCRLAACGDGITRQDLVPGQSGYEACDDGNEETTDFCLNDCSLARCGDGYVWTDREACDDGNDVQTDGCTSSCSPARCGDGFVREDKALEDPDYEACDDGNRVDLDDCRNDCSVPSWLRCGDRLRFSEQVLTDNGGGEGMRPFALDLDRDGDIDLGFINQTSATYTYLNQGARQFAEGSRINIPRSGGGNATGDLDGDGVSDLVVAHQDGRYLSIRRSGGGDALSVVSTLSVGEFPEMVRMADLNADGALDLLVGDRRERCWYVLIGDGSGEFEVGRCIAPGHVLAVADIDRGGRPELVVVAERRVLQVYALDESLEPVFLRAVAVEGLGIINEAQGYDADGDEHVDLIVSGSFGDEQRVATLINNTQGELINCSLSEPLTARPAVFVDLDGDGGLDLVSLAYEARRSVYRVFWQEFAQQACGNGVLEADERCDDGNRESGDGCSASCAVESDGACHPEVVDGASMAATAAVHWECCGRGNNPYQPTAPVVELPGGGQGTALVLNRLQTNWAAFDEWQGQRRWYETHSQAVWVKPEANGRACLMARFGPPTLGNHWNRQRATLCWTRHAGQLHTWVQGRLVRYEDADFGGEWVRLGFEVDAQNERLRFFVNDQPLHEYSYSAPGDDVTLALLCEGSRARDTTSCQFAELGVGRDRYDVCFVPEDEPAE